ncbi:MAG: cytochrome c nitrite reductase small subunit [Candidatus Omnitrophota bacterium]
MIKSFLNGLIPPKEWRIPVTILLGILAGVILIVLRISNATSYLSDDPKACINCHVMFPQYETWLHSSHREVAVCNDCHVPHDTAINKYFFKARDGLRHSTIYTLRTEPQVIRMHEEGQAVVQSNCIRCHEKLFDGTDLIHGTYEQYVKGDAKLCWQCHREVPHGRVRSLAATPYYHVPQLSDAAPEEMESLRDFLEKLIYTDRKN